MRSLSLLIKPVSGRCNMSCGYCFYRALMKDGCHESMTDKTLDNLVRKAFASADESVTFAFQGGEPTLAGLDYYKDLIRMQKIYNRRGIRVYNSIQTNGFNMSDELSAFLADNGFLTGLSIDGTKRIHDTVRGSGTYEKAVTAAKMLTEHSAVYNILCVVTPTVTENACEVYNGLKKYGYLQFIPCIDDSTGKYARTPDTYGNFLVKTFDMYYNDYIHGRYVSVRNFDNYIGIILGEQPESCELCGVCGQYFVIEGDGECYPCDFYASDEWKLGNINNNSFSSMLKCENAVRFSSLGRIIPYACRECKYLVLCRGGCRRFREPFTDGIPSVNKYCDAYKMLFDRRLDKMKEMAARIGQIKRPLL